MVAYSKDKKIKALVYTVDNIQDANNALRVSLSPMGRAGFDKNEIDIIDEKIEAVRAQLEALQQEILRKIYSLPDS